MRIDELSASAPSICVVPNVHGVGGMVSFRRKFEAGLRRRGVRLVADPSEPGYRALLIIGGTRRFIDLRRARRRGVPVVQRLDGMNWLHRLPSAARPASSGLRHYLRAEYGNLVLRLIRTRLATHLVYQSRFVQGWWQRSEPVETPHTVIYNGVDLDVYTPDGPETPPLDRTRILLVEGALAGGYEGGLDSAVRLVERLVQALPAGAPPLELKIAGRVDPAVQSQVAAKMQRLAPRAQVEWAGLVAAQTIPALDRSAHLLFSADLNAACPNSVVEALACGLPVIGYATGALPEMVPAAAGRLADYGGDPWKLEPPDADALAAAARAALACGAALRVSARAHAEAEFGLERMIDRYLDTLLGGAA